MRLLTILLAPIPIDRGALDQSGRVLEGIIESVCFSNLHQILLSSITTALRWASAAGSLDGANPVLWSAMNDLMFPMSRPAEQS